MPSDTPVARRTSACVITALPLLAAAQTQAAIFSEVIFPSVGGAPGIELSRLTAVQAEHDELTLLLVNARPASIGQVEAGVSWSLEPGTETLWLQSPGQAFPLPWDYLAPPSSTPDAAPFLADPHSPAYLLLMGGSPLWIPQDSPENIFIGNQLINLVFDNNPLLDVLAIGGAEPLAYPDLASLDPVFDADYQHGRLLPEWDAAALPSQPIDAATAPVWIGGDAADINVDGVLNTDPLVYRFSPGHINLPAAINIPEPGALLFASAAALPLLLRRRNPARNPTA